MATGEIDSPPWSEINEAGKRPEGGGSAQWMTARRTDLAMDRTGTEVFDPGSARSILALPGSNTSVPVRSIAKSVRRAVIHCADPPPSGRLPASLISLHGGESISPVAIHDFRMSVATNAADRQYRHALC